VQKARDDLLSGARLALDQDGGIRRSDLRDPLDHAAKPGAGADDGRVVASIISNGTAIKLNGLARCG
jgi:hypothetical protein